MVETSLDIKQKISSFLALTLILLISLVLGWYSIKTSDDLLNNAPNSRALSVNKRIQDKNSEGSKEIQNMLKEDEIDLDVR